MGLFDTISKTIFGEPEEPEARSASTLTPQQEALLNKIIGMVMPQIGKGVQPYPGTTVPSEEFLQPYYAGATGIVEDPLYKQTGLALQQGLSGQALYDTDLDKAREYWEDVYYKPAMAEFKQDILPQLREDYAGLGAYDSGGRRRAETQAAQRFATETGAKLGDILWAETQAGRQAKERALERGLQYTPEYLGLPLSYQKDVGLTQAGFEAQRLGEAKENWLAEQPYASPYLGLGYNALGVNATQPYIYQESPSYLMQLLQGASGGLGTAFGASLAGLI
jgi:hypothetical protein